jgi:hypothetical protein
MMTFYILMDFKKQVFRKAILLSLWAISPLILYLAPAKAAFQYFHENAASDGSVGGSRMAPPPAVCLPKLRGANKTINHLGEGVFRVVEAKDQPPCSYPSQCQTLLAQIEL